MGSSPVTATIPIHSMEILGALEAFFRSEAPLGPGDGVVAAFSGGPDSTALLLGMARLASRRPVRVVAAHLDHGTDGGSADRAAAAGRLAARLGVSFVTERREVPALRRPAESPESAGRRERYAFLERVRRETGARWIATGHHRDDQAETVLLRLAYGSGLEGLAGIRPVHGAVVRPLLGLSRAELRAAVEAAGVVPLEDPTNADLGLPRNRLRHRLLPALEGGDPGTAERLARLAGKARTAGDALERRLGDLVRPTSGGIAIERGRWESLPAPLQPFALAALHRRAGAPYPAGSAARSELLRQIGERGRAGCDCGGGWRWEASGDLLVLRRRQERERVADFTYTLEIPGTVDVPELAVQVEVSRRPVEPWMFRGSLRRAALALPLGEGGRVTVRNRRAGDRLRPLGAGGSRRLKCVLVDRRIPRHQRERLPLLCVGEQIAWVPGVTIDERFRLRAGDTTAWVAEVTTR